MSRTPLLSLLREMYSESQAAQRLGQPVDEVHEQRLMAMQEARAAGLSRRQFLVGASALAAASLVPWRRSRAGGQPRIAIIGGGMAGLSCAVTLLDYGYTATIYEAQPRTGGRMLTDRGGANGCSSCHQPRDGQNGGGLQWADNQYTDVYGELVDTQHTTMHDFAARFGVGMVNAIEREPAGAEETYYFRGGWYPRAKMCADFVNVWPVIKKDLKAAGYPTTYASSTPSGRILDKMTLYDWIESRIPGGHNAPLGQLIDTAFVDELGADTRDQSALNALYMIGFQPRGFPRNSNMFNVFGTSDEAYRIEGGSEALTDAMAAWLRGSGVRINLGWHLESVNRRSDGTCSLAFDGQGTSNADIVVLALPFSKLRHMDFSGAGFDALKVRAIQGQGAAHNGKINLQFTERYWRKPTPNPWGSQSGGTSYSDTFAQLTWDTTRIQPGTSGILVVYNGGSACDSMKLNHPYGNSATNAALRTDALTALAAVERIYPGIGAYWNGMATGSKAHIDEHYYASYGFYKPGQYQTICGYERVPQRNCYFCGEHTSLDFFGFMEGAAAEGVSCAQQVLSDLGLKIARTPAPSSVAIG